MKPVVAIYSTFLQRAYDQLIHDIALQNLPVVFAIDRAGLVGADGPTHAGSFDLSFLRCIPNMMVMAPTDENECRQMLYTAFLHDGPSAVRYPRGSGTGRRDRSRKCRRCRSARARCAAQGRRSRHPRLRQHARAGAGRPPKNSMPRWPTCASSSRWTRNCCCELAHSHRPAGDAWRKTPSWAAPAARVAEALAELGSDRAGAATRPARPLHRAGRSGQNCWLTAAWTRTASFARCSQRIHPIT